ncbi:MAG: alpha-2-macroglobulin, partial [Planctomycetota bacterium]|nr:alpha-2-macroglobulin [Planctomycetota bacterium]
VDGKKHKEVKVNAANLFTFDNAVVIAGDAVETGKHTIELRKKGVGPLYFNVYLSYFTLEDFITKAGMEIKVARKVYRLKPVDKTAEVAGSRTASNRSLQWGEQFVQPIFESKNDYEYVVFEDHKAAGFEPVEVRSGYTGNDLGAYVEFRDERVAFFVRQLARGNHSVCYRLRAEIPGRFSALPARGYAMYAPELKGNSDEIKLRIED